MSLQTDLHCRKGCGFYGNPEWNWHCSKCWREHLRKTGSASATTSTPSVRSQDHPVTAPPSKPSGTSVTRSTSIATAMTLPQSPKKSFLSSQASFSKFEDKKKRQTLDKNFKQIFQGRSFGGSSSKESPEKHSRNRNEQERRPKADYPPEAKLVSQEFVGFLKKRLTSAGISDISKQVKGFTDKLIREAATLSMSPNHEERIHDLSAQVQEFYQIFRRRLETKDFYHTLTEDDLLKILDFSEKFIMICSYKSLFCPASTNDEEKDLELQTKIRNLNWLSTQELKCPLDESSQEVRDLLNEAIHDILEVDGKMAPQDKLDCIVRCSKKVFDILKVSNENPASADDFLPCLIYVCLRANPPRVQSNINFITRFCNENKLRMGEGGYFFANLCCAISFIENMTADSINMDPDEFESYVSGRAQPPGSWRSAMLTCEGLHFMSQNVKTLSDLKNRLNRVHDEATSLQQNMDQFQRDIEAEVRSVLDRTPFEILGPKVPVAVDADLGADVDSLRSLPPPLVPQSMLPIFDFTSASPAAMKGSGAARSFHDNSMTTALEDFLSVSSPYDAGDTSSLLSLNISNFSDTGETLADTSLTTHEGLAASDSGYMSLPPTVYRGFSAQSSTIPSIACDSDVSLLAFAERVSSPPMSASSMKSSVTSSSQATDTMSDIDDTGNKKCHVSSSSGSSNDLVSSSSSTSSSSPSTSSPPQLSSITDVAMPMESSTENTAASSPTMETSPRPDDNS